MCKLKTEKAGIYFICIPENQSNCYDLQNIRINNLFRVHGLFLIAG